MNVVFRDYRVSSFDTSLKSDFFKLIDNNRDRLEDFFAGTVSKTKTLKDTINYCKVIEQNVKNKSYFPFIISSLKDDKFIGLVDAKNIDWNIPKAEIGYFVDSNFEGQGLISQSLNLVIDYLTETHQFKKLLCRIGTNNIGSINAALKSGFEYEGTIRRDYKTTRGEIVDLNYYVRIF